MVWWPRAKLVQLSTLRVQKASNNNNFLLTISLHHQEKSVEIINWSPKGKYFHLFSNILSGNIWRSVSRICVWISGAWRVDRNGKVNERVTKHVHTNLLNCIVHSCCFVCSVFHLYILFYHNLHMVSIADVQVSLSLLLTPMQINRVLWSFNNPCFNSGTSKINPLVLL